MAEQRGQIGKNQFDNPRTKADEDAIRAGHAAGKSLHQIAKEIGRSKGCVSRWADQMDLDFERSRTEAASNARRADGVARRQALKAGTMDLYDELIAEVKKPGRSTIMRAAGGAEVVDQLDFVPLRDYREAADAASRFAAAIKALDSLDQDSGVASAISLLDRMVTKIGLTDAVDKGSDDA